MDAEDKGLRVPLTTVGGQALIPLGIPERLTDYLEIMRWVALDCLEDEPDVPRLIKRMTNVLSTRAGIVFCLYAWERARDRMKSAMDLRAMSEMLADVDMGGGADDFPVPEVLREPAERLIPKFHDHLRDGLDDRDLCRLQMYVVGVTLVAVLDETRNAWDGDVRPMRDFLAGEPGPDKTYLVMTEWLLGALGVFVGDPPSWLVHFDVIAEHIDASVDELLDKGLQGIEDEGASWSRF